MTAGVASLAPTRCVRAIWTPSKFGGEDADTHGGVAEIVRGQLGLLHCSCTRRFALAPALALPRCFIVLFK